LKKPVVKKILRKPIVKNILSALAVAVFGFILLNLAFIFDALFQNVVKRFLRLFTSTDLNMAYNWYPPTMHATFVVIICLISWPVFRSKLGTLYKATYMTVPLAVVFVTLGISFYRRPAIAYALGGLFGIGVLYYLYRTKKPWLYYYALILIGLVMLMVGLFKIEI